MKLPILLNHDEGRRIGTMESIDGRLHFRFNDDVEITKDAAFEIFGGAGLAVLEATDKDGVMLIRAGRIVEFSWSPTPALPNVANKLPAIGGSA